MTSQLTENILYFKIFYILKYFGNYCEIVLNKLIYKMTLLSLSQGSKHENLPQKITKTIPNGKKPQKVPKR